MFKPFLLTGAALTLLAACDTSGLSTPTATQGPGGCRVDPGDISPGQMVMTENEALLLQRVQAGTATGAEEAYVEQCLNPLMTDN